MAVAPAAALQGDPGATDPAPAPALPDARTQRGGANGRVLVLNASYEAINVCTVRRAAVLVLKERAEIIERGEHALHSETFEMPRPAVIRLTSYVRVPRDAHSRKITRRAIFARDKWACQYCGSAHPQLTVDHVVPRSKGGPSSWDNVVTCCAPCNRRKGDRLPKHAGMHPKTKPAPPNSTIFVHVAVPKVPSVWQQYLAA